MYLGHVSPESQTARSIKESVFNFMEEKSVCREQLYAVGCDGTSVNTGSKG